MMSWTLSRCAVGDAAIAALAGVAIFHAGLGLSALYDRLWLWWRRRRR